jgi:hypothetical protein
MERPPMVIDWQNKYYENAHSIESNLQIQAMSIKILVILCRNRKANLKINMEE